MKKITIYLFCPLMVWCGWTTWKINTIEAGQSVDFKEYQKKVAMNNIKELEENVIIMTSFQERLDAYEEGLGILAKNAGSHQQVLDAHEKCIRLLNYRRN